MIERLTERIEKFAHSLADDLNELAVWIDARNANGVHTTRLKVFSKYREIRRYRREHP